MEPLTLSSGECLYGKYEARKFLLIVILRLSKELTLPSFFYNLYMLLFHPVTITPASSVAPAGCHLPSPRQPSHCCCCLLLLMGLDATGACGAALSCPILQGVVRGSFLPHVHRLAIVQNTLGRIKIRFRSVIKKSFHQQNFCSCSCLKIKTVCLHGHKISGDRCVTPQCAHRVLTVVGLLHKTLKASRFSPVILIQSLFGSAGQVGLLISVFWGAGEEKSCHCCH